MRKLFLEKHPNYDIKSSISYIYFQYFNWMWIWGVWLTLKVFFFSLFKKKTSQKRKKKEKMLEYQVKQKHESKLQSQHKHLFLQGGSLFRSSGWCISDRFHMCLAACRHFSSAVMLMKCCHFTFLETIHSDGFRVFTSGRFRSSPVDGLRKSFMSGWTKSFSLTKFRSEPCREQAERQTKAAEV